MVMGLSICYDLRFPELYRSLGLRGASAVFVPSAFTRETGRDHWEILLRARAIENLCYVVAPAQSGDHGGGRASYGRSMIIGPWGQIMAQCQDGEGYAMADLDPERLVEARRRLPGARNVIIRTLS
jgi:predicted amidohydrolase